MPNDIDTQTETPMVEAPVAAPDPAVSREPEAAPQGATSEASAEPKSLLDAALMALKTEEKPGEATAAKPAGEDPAAEQGPQVPETDAAAQGEAPGAVPRLPDDVFKALPQEARRAFNDLRKQVTTLQPDATRGQALTQFLRETGITVPEYDELIEVGALLKHDPAKARERLAAKLAEVDHALGLTLPDDLREEVDGGYISEDRASELSRTRAEAERAKRAAEELVQSQHQNALVNDLVSWEAEMRQRDPDFDRKLPDIQAKARLAVLEASQAGKPVRTGAEAVRVAQKAYGEVNALLASFRPAPRATPPSPSSAASAPAAVVAPKNIYEAAAAGLAGR